MLRVLSVSLLCAICVSCGPATAPENIGNPFLNDQLYFVQPGGYISADDTVNTRAIVWIENEYQELTASAVFEPQYLTVHRAHVTFHTSIPTSGPLADIYVNDSSLSASNDWSLTGAETDGSAAGFQTHLNKGATSNTLRKSADAYLGSIDTVVTFNEPIRLMHVGFGEALSVASEKSFTYSGPGGNMEISLTAHSEPDDMHSQTSVKKAFYGTQGGSVTLDLRTLHRQVGKDARLEIKRWDMHFLPTSNGTKIAFIATSVHQTLVRLVE